MGTTNLVSGFHDRALVADWLPVSAGHWDSKFRYTYENFFHPFVGELLAQLNRGSLADVMDSAWQESLKENFFESFYNLPHDRLVEVISFAKEIDVDLHGSYSNYNWELFFHIPLTIAVHLSKTRRFAESQRWFHYIFDPTSNDSTVEPPMRFWKFLAFRNESTPKGIDDLLTLLSKNPAELSADDQALRHDVLNGYRAVLDKPFQPHAVARTRILAYQYSVVMKYLDNLIAWGDDLFQQYTIETINEATQLYVLASNLLGPRPERIPPLGTVQPKTFAQLKAIGLSEIGNALVDLENEFPFDFDSSGQGNSSMDDSGPLFGIGRTLYFCIPRNEKLLGYWDTVADRLFKMRHCMDIQGVVRPLALFDPPLDPGMLVKAAAAGLDLSNIMSGLNQPVGPIRCQILIQKALELSAEVSGLGNSLLSAIERGDAEHLALVRQRHEIQIQQMAQEVRFLQWKQAEGATESLLRSRASALERYRYYQRLLGLSADTTDVPDQLGIDRRELTEDNFDEAYAALVDQYAAPVPEQGYPTLRQAPESAANLIALTLQTGNLHLNVNEFLDLNVLGPAALVLRALSATTDTTTTALASLPDAYVDYQYWGVGGHAKIAGGSKVTDSGRSASRALSQLALISEIAASYTSKAAGYQRRTDEWTLQHNLAANELMQIGRQILTALIAEQIAHHDYQSMQQQLANAQEVDQFLHDKFTNEDLGLWMQGEISRLYFEYYRFAFDTARRAERTMKQELMRTELDAQDFVKFNYWDAGRKGLLAGEALHLDVKRMEMAYLDNKKRELELTRHVSLRQLDPLALLSLRTNGVCQIEVPEWLYDKDCPGHYLRRIKSIALTIPSVVGPYTSVNCTLTLLKSSVRRSPLLGDGEYIRQGSEDDRFIDYAGAVQSIVTSSAIGDSGMFETNLRDERFLPFEGAGAISTWMLELPRDFRAFDYATISDVVLHIRYTARQGVDSDKVKASLVDLFAGQSTPEGARLTLLFSLPHDFPTEWAAFVGGTSNFTATVKRDYFPFFTQGRNITVTGLELYAADPAKHHAIDDSGVATTDLGDNNAFVVTAPPDEAGPLQVLVRRAGLEAFLAVQYLLS